MPDPDCLFCRIIAGEIPATRVVDDETVIAIRDIAPRAPTHVLFLPREHIVSAADLTPDDGPMLGQLFGAAATYARAEGLTDAGYRMVTNVGDWGGQTVGPPPRPPPRRPVDDLATRLRRSILAVSWP